MPRHLTTDDTTSFVTATEVGVANGIAQLGADGKVPNTQLPAVFTGSVTSVNGQVGNVVLNASNVGAYDTATSDGRYVHTDAQVVSVRDHGAVGDDTHDDIVGINAAMAACPSGGVVFFPAGSYRTSAPVRVPPGVTLMGTHVTHLPGASDVTPTSRIKPLSSFTGGSVIELVDQTTGSYPGGSGEQRMIRMVIDGSAAPANVDGLKATGYVHGVILDDVAFRSVTGRGVNTSSGTSGNPYSWRLRGVVVSSAGNIGFSLNGLTDSTLIDCEAIGGTSHGFFLATMANSHLTNCRAEWNGLHGFYLSGSWGTGTGSGGATLTGCSTDRNNFDGVRIDATGNAPITITGLMNRRDGRNGGSAGGSYSGLNVASATVPVIVNGMSCYPGVDDNGSGSPSPQYALSVSGSTLVNVSDAYLHGNTAATNIGSGNTSFAYGANITFVTGTTSAPVRSVQNIFVPYSQRGAASGVATLDTNALVPRVQIPSLADLYQQVPASTPTASGQFLTAVASGSNSTQWSRPMTYTAASAAAMPTTNIPLGAICTRTDTPQDIYVWDGSAWQYTPNTSTPWRNCTVVSPWRGYNNNDTAWFPQVRRINNMVYIRGGVELAAGGNGTISNTSAVITVPSDCSPTRMQNLIGACTNTSTQNGTMRWAIQGGTTNVYIYLSGTTTAPYPASPWFAIDTFYWLD